MAELRLKNYQQTSIDVLRDYFKACDRKGNAAEAYAEVLHNEDSPHVRAVYQTPLDALNELPYVCLKLPTGAGKTLLASHVPGVALRHLLHAEQGIILWLVTSETIRKQTLDALKDREHPYRIALERGLGSVTIMDIEQAIGLNRARLNSSSLVIVATIQSFRREDAGWLRVHRDSSANMDVFDQWERLPENVKARLEMHEEAGRPLYSLANALCLRRPVVIVDEAHNTSSKLSYETLGKVYPSCIIELTATPKANSNVLHCVSAAELDAEEMIKMPIRLETRSEWRLLLADAINMREQLEQLAKRERQESRGEYIRPVMLIQAQKKNQEINIDALHECLKADYRIPEAQIAVATAAKDTLAEQDLGSEDCPVRYVLTVDKLREGWDCPFAYVLATVRELKSSTAIEQILGRVMRLPGACKKSAEALNRAYAFSVSDHIGPALGTLRESLVEIGFGKTESKSMVIAAPRDEDVQAMFELDAVEDCPQVSIRMPEPVDMEVMSSETKAIVSYEAASESIVVSAPMPEEVSTELQEKCSTDEGKAAIRQAFVISQKLKPQRSPVQQGSKFAVPLLCYRQGDFLEPFEDTHFLDYEWQLSKCDATLTEEDYSSASAKGEQGEIYHEDGRIQSRFIRQLHEYMERIAPGEGWTLPRLVQWFDHSILHSDISAEETGIFLTNAIGSLVTERGMALADLIYDKYRLRDCLERKIEQYRQEARRRAYQSLLFDGDSLVVEPADPRAIFRYTNSPFSYGTSNPYTGGHRFSKHFYPRIFDLKPEGEEFECACFLDSLDGVEYWVRNIERRPDDSFWLQTSSDRFYPDFVCKLRNGKVLVVEYKGEDRWSNDDSREKRNLGELWQERSNGECLFVMPKGKDFDAISAKTV